MSNKGEKLHQEYKKIKDNNKRTDGRRIEWKYFDKLDEMLAARPATQPPILVEMLKPVVSDSDKTDIDRQDDNNNSIVDLHGQSDGVTDDASDNPSGSSTAYVSGKPHSHNIVVTL